MQTGSVWAVQGDERRRAAKAKAVVAAVIGADRAARPGDTIILGFKRRIATLARQMLQFLTIFSSARAQAPHRLMRRALKVDVASALPVLALSLAFPHPP